MSENGPTSTKPFRTLAARVEWPALTYISGAVVLVTWANALAVLLWAIGGPAFYVFGRTDEASARDRSVAPGGAS